MFNETDSDHNYILIIIRLRTSMKIHIFEDSIKKVKSQATIAYLTRVISY